MEPIKIKISNYRTIPYTQPVELEIKDGITFILGANNVGKSNLLKLFYEFRSNFVFDIGYVERRAGHSGGDRFFDHFANRKNAGQSIIIEFKHGDTEITYTIEPRGGISHSNTIDTSYTIPFAPK